MMKKKFNKLISCAVSAALAMSSLIVPSVNVCADDVSDQAETVQVYDVPESGQTVTTVPYEVLTTTTTTTTADPDDNRDEYVLSLNVSVIDNDTKEAVSDVGVKLIKAYSDEDVRIDPVEAIENGRYTVIDEWTTSTEPVHNIPTFNAGGYEDVKGYFYG